MSEPSSSVVAAVVGGWTGAAVFAALGIEPAPLFWSSVGCCIGVSFAGPVPRIRGAVVFATVALACSLLGSYLAQAFATGTPITRNAFSCLLAVGFHPLLNAAVTRIPAALDGLLRKFGLGGTP
jgi:hypothetical protein